MKNSALKHRLNKREMTIGSWLSFAYSPLCEMMAKAGFDWLVIDMEHTPIDYSQAEQLIQIIDLAGCVPLVRVGANDPLIIKRVMEMGAYGILVPQVTTAEEAKQAVESVYYPPLGTRGAGLYRAQDYGLGFHDYLEWAQTNSIVIVQIEHVDGVQNLEEILAIEGVDGFIVGPYDLSASVGQAGNFEHPAVAEALQEIQKIAQSSRKVGGYHIVQSNHAELEERIQQGYTFIAYGDDMVFMAEKLSAESAFIRKIKAH
jgi:2-dehydro-3-deoxyglucarate aldolase